MKAAAQAAAQAGRIALVFAAIVCLLFTASLRDVPSGEPRHLPVAPLPLPAAEPRGQGIVAITVVGADGEPVEGASVRALLLRDEVAYLAGAAVTDGAGRAKVTDLPEGELFVLCDAEGRTRASSRLVLGKGAERGIALRLRPALSLELFVTDDAKVPLAHAFVEVDAGDPLPYVGETASDGHVRVGRLGPPSWRVRVGAPGYETVEQWVTKSPKGALAAVLRKLGAFEVLVVDGQGAPVRGAEVVIVGSGLWPARRAQTDGAGRTELSDLPAGIYDLRATLGDLVSSSGLGVRLGRGEKRAVTLALSAGRRVLVRALDGEGDGARPVAKADVVLTEGGLSPFPLEGATDGAGRVTLGPISLGVDAYVAVRADTFVPRSGVLVPAGPRPELAVPLVKSATLRGDVRDARGFPVSGASIEVVGTGASGEPIDESPERIAFRAAHFSWALPGPARLRTAGELGVMVGPIPPIPHGGSLASLLAASPRPLGGAGRLRLPPPPEPWVTRSDGTFRASPVPPGRMRAIVRHPAYVEASSEAVSLPAAGEAEVHVVLYSGGALEGRVLDVRRDPVGGAHVDLAAVRGSLERTTVAAQDGTFAFASVPSEISLSVARPDAPGEVVLRTSLTVKDGERREIELVLPLARDRMRVRAVDERGDPLPAVQVLALSLAPDQPMRRTLYTDRDGVCVFPDAVGLPLRVQATMRGRAPAALEIAAAPAELDLPMAPGLTVVGRVTTRAGHDNAEGAEVVVYGAAGTARARTDKGGSYQLVDVAPGRARLAVSLAGHAPVERGIEIAAGTRADRPIELDPIDLADAGTVQGEVVDARGDPAPFARVGKDRVLDYVPSGAERSGVTSDKNGAFVLPDLPEGEVILEAVSADKGRGHTKAVVRAGRTTDGVKIALAPDEPGGQGDSEAGGVAVTLEDSKGAVVVRKVASGSEAERGGVEVGDRITAVDGHAVRTVPQARTRLFGPLEGDVIVEIVRGADKHTLRVVRERVQR